MVQFRLCVQGQAITRTTYHSSRTCHLIFFLYQTKECLISFRNNSFIWAGFHPQSRRWWRVNSFFSFFFRSIYIRETRWGGFVFCLLWLRQGLKLFIRAKERLFPLLFLPKLFAESAKKMFYKRRRETDVCVYALFIVPFLQKNWLSFFFSVLHIVLAWQKRRYKSFSFSFLRMIDATAAEVVYGNWR